MCGEAREGSVNYVLTLEGITFATELARYGSWMKQMKLDTACGEPPLGSEGVRRRIRDRKDIGDISDFACLTSFI